MRFRVFQLLALGLLLSALAASQDVASFEKRITVKKLDNGLTILICERPEAPVFSFFTLVDAGSAQDPWPRPGWPTCSSTWLSRAPTKLAPITMRRKSPPSPRLRSLTPLTLKNATNRWAVTTPGC